jgi:hypothetical protein
VTLALTAAALWLGWKEHRSVPVLVLFGAGIAVLLFARKPSCVQVAPTRSFGIS